MALTASHGVVMQHCGETSIFHMQEASQGKRHSEVRRGIRISQTPAFFIAYQIIHE